MSHQQHALELHGRALRRSSGARVFRHLRTALLAMFCLFSGTLLAQQDYHFTQFNFNKLALNPAYAGSRGVFSSTAVYRHQWTGFEGAPRTFSLAMHSPIGKERLSLGALIFSDRLGVSSKTGLFLMAGYRLPLGDKSHLSAALQGGFLDYRNRLTELNPSDPDDQLLQEDLRALLPNLGFGIYWASEKSFAGISMPRVAQNDLTRIGDFDDVRTAFLYRHLYIMGGHVFDLGPAVKLRPSALLKYVGGDGIATPFDFDLNLAVLLLDKVWIGGAYRLNDAVGVMAEYQITDRLMAGYAHDFTITELGGQHSGTHEVMLRYELRFDKDSWITPRYIRYF